MDLQIFQTLVRRWVVRAFGEDVANDKAERTHRFLEEALELAQATDCTQEQAHALVEYVYGREMGQPMQEVGGTLLTLAALCAARDISLNVAATAEISRVNTPAILDKIRLKQAAKKTDIPLSPLPGKVDEPLLHRKPDRRAVERTHTDAVGTDGGKATVARKI